MTDIILSRIEKRLKKVETKISTMKDNYEEMDNNLEDMYETINDLKSSEPNNDNNNINTFTSGNNKDYIDSRDSRNINDSRVLNNTQINKIIEKIINKNTGLDPGLDTGLNTGLDTNNLKQNAYLCYTKLIQNQPQLKDDSIKEHITYFIEQNDSQRKTILDNFEKVFDSFVNFHNFNIILDQALS